MMAWRSLVAFRDTGLQYDYLDVYRLVDIYFERDGADGYPSIRHVVSLDLLILVLGMADLPNKLLPSLLTQMLTLRRDKSHPTWVFAPFSSSRVREVYGSEVAELLGEVRPVVDGPDTPVALRVPADVPRVFGYNNLK